MLILICDIQGAGLWSPFAGKIVTTQGIVTGVVRRGFFIQSVQPSGNFATSDGLFVYSPGWLPSLNLFLEVTGEVMDYVNGDNGKPTTQLKFDTAKPLEQSNLRIEPFVLNAHNLPSAPVAQAKFLNGLEAMFVKIEAGHTFIAPSNPFGDYVLTFDTPDNDLMHSDDGGVLLDHENPLRWFPGFRVTDYDNAPRVNVGAKLTSSVVGPLHYRVESYQIAASKVIGVTQNEITLQKSRLKPSANSLTIMTLNCFNLDVCVESEDKVINPRQDVDDDWGDGRFHSLAKAITLQANCPDIIALQEIQDNDGAEISDEVSASDTYKVLIKMINKLCDVNYRWVEIAPDVGADGGQPGGNIRNAFLFNPDRVELVSNTASLFSENDDCFVASRKPLIAHFREKVSAKVIACINVHLVSKRHQNSIFAPENPGVDSKLAVRVEQAKRIRDKLRSLEKQGIEYYLTGDFNDTQDSDTLNVFNKNSVNLVRTLVENDRYDYNHRGKLQVLMHGLVSKKIATKHAEYEIIHGNELIGVSPGREGNKPSDHAYVIAKIILNS